MNLIFRFLKFEFLFFENDEFEVRNFLNFSNLNCHSLATVGYVMKLQLEAKGLVEAER